MNLMGNQYELGSGWLSDINTLSDITYSDIINYLVKGFNYSTLDQI